MVRYPVLIALFGVVSCRDPRAEANVAQAMIDVGTELSSLRQDYAVLEAQVDSLQRVVARQDTIMTRLASMAGLPLSRP